MSLSLIVVDNSAIVPAFFPEEKSPHFDAGLVTNRSRALVLAIRLRRVQAFVPPSFYREFLNGASRPLEQRSGSNNDTREWVREQWSDLLTLPLSVVPIDRISHHAGTLVLDDRCPAADAWYVVAAVETKATFWMSHRHVDGLYEVASQHVDVKLLADTAPGF